MALRQMIRFEEISHDEQIVVSLIRQLSRECDYGFSEKNLRIMIQCAETFPDE